MRYPSNSTLRILQMLRWLLLIEIVSAVWGGRLLWQEYKERQQAIIQWQHASQKWVSVEQRIKSLQNTNAMTLLYQDDLVVGLRLQDNMTLTHWREALSEIQNQYWLALERATWHRSGELWQADLTWHFTKPEILKPEQDWLPISSQSEWPSKGELLTTLNNYDASALININGDEHWHKQGSWLPALHATLTEIDQDGIVLTNSQGEQRRIELNRALSLYDDSKEP
ncbi:hypothetical protein [Marinomonas ostreistagni]|uniref:Uncharacterized protein n=1 Tax=Marinomonas ostreistagni TaxID=359209 RepID=A0ABS0ZBJ9_9GAMM|nr:hypothetical protein [Marinomonas ostreistagni]MBJ7551022.1 hypothetical protein [Marinomonas ostreistagni]